MTGSVKILQNLQVLGTSMVPLGGAAGERAPVNMNVTRTRRAAWLAPVLLAASMPLVACSSTEEKCDAIFQQIADAGVVSDSDQRLLKANCGYWSDRPGRDLPTDLAPDGVSTA